jgi:hypothetical protein
MHPKRLDLPNHCYGDSVLAMIDNELEYLVGQYRNWVLDDYPTVPISVRWVLYATARLEDHDVPNNSVTSRDIQDVIIVARHDQS